MEDFKFSTLEYKRPDFEKTGAFAEEITEKTKCSIPMENKRIYGADGRDVEKFFDRTVRSHPSAIH